MRHPAKYGNQDMDLPVYPLKYLYEVQGQSPKQQQIGSNIQILKSVKILVHIGHQNLIYVVMF